MTLFWVSIITEREALMDLDVLQMKKEDVLKLLVAEIHLGATNFDFQMERTSLKGEVMASTS